MSKKKIETLKQFRQGDVLVDITNLKKMPANATKVARDAGRIILAYGEVTGHAHAIMSQHATLCQDGNMDRYLQVKRTCYLRHEEHGEISIPPGIYKVTRQREYSPEAIRNVAD